MNKAVCPLFTEFLLEISMNYTRALFADLFICGNT